MACPRCDRYHERVCGKCDFEPACHDHNCWSIAELEKVIVKEVWSTEHDW